MTLREAQNVVILLTSGVKSLVDSRSICDALSQALHGAKYEIEVSESSSSESEPEVVDRNTKRKRGASSSSSSPPKQPTRRISDSSPAMTVRELEGQSDIEDAAAHEGFIDETSGEQVYLIEKVVKYEPRNGYFVHWQGYPKSERTWQRPEDMPTAFAKEMKRARDRYNEAVRSSRASL